MVTWSRTDVPFTLNLNDPRDEPSDQKLYILFKSFDDSDLILSKCDVPDDVENIAVTELMQMAVEREYKKDGHYHNSDKTDDENAKDANALFELNKQLGFEVFIAFVVRDVKFII